MENVTRSKKHIVIKYSVHTLIICITVYFGYLASGYLMATKPKVKKRRLQREAFVKTAVTTTHNHFTNVSVMGTVTPSQQIDIFPQVQGKLSEISPSLVPGGFLKKGTILATIDPVNEKRNVAEANANLAIATAQLQRAQQDYQVEQLRLAVEQKKADANLKSALTQYKNALQQSQRQEQLLQGRLTSEEAYELARTTTIQKNSELETARLRLDELKTEEKALRLKKQDIELAQQRVNLNSILLQKARQNLQYTKISTPFDAFVIAKRVGQGSTVTTSTNIATIVSVDYYWVEATIPVSQLSWIQIPSNRKQGSAVKITHRSWPQDVFREGKVERLLPRLEPESKMAKLLIRIQDPLLRKQKKADRPVLLLGSFVRLNIAGKTLKNVIQISRKHLQDGNFVWVLAQNELQKRLVKIVWREKDYVFVSEGIEVGEKIVISQVPGAVNGMAVKEIQQ